MALFWFLAGALMCVTIVGIPIVLQAFKMGSLVLWPFGKEVKYSNMKTGSVLLNMLWIILFGWELAFASFILGLGFSVTIIGLPFGLQWFKFASLALFPFGATIEDRQKWKALKKKWNKHIIIGCFISLSGGWDHKDDSRKANYWN